MTVLNWGFLGTARINRRLILPLKTSARNRVVAVASRDPARAEAYARQWELPRAYGSYETLLADPAVDVVYNSLPNHLHAEWTIRALRAGKHVLCEKPLALSLAEVDAMAVAAQASGRVLTEAFMYRHHPQTQRVQALLAEGAVGQLLFIRGSFSFVVARADDVRLVADWGGGGLWDVGCYPVSYARLVAGAEPEEVFGWQVAGRGGVDEMFTGQLRFPNGLLAQFDCSLQAPYRTGLEIVGSAGVLTIPTPFRPDEQPGFTLRRGDQTATLSGPAEDPYLAEVEDLADAVLSGRPPRLGLADSRANTAALLALRQSALTGRPVRVEAA